MDAYLYSMWQIYRILAKKTKAHIFNLQDFARLGNFLDKLRLKLKFAIARLILQLST